MKLKKFTSTVQWLFTVFTLLLVLSCSDKKENNTQITNEQKSLSKMINITSSEEYKELNDLEKNVVNLINSSINGLRGMALHSKANLSKYYATINIDVRNVDSGLSNYILLSSKNNLDYEKSYKTHSSNPFTVCDIREGTKCAKQIIAHIEEKGLSELDVHIEVNNDGYYEISW